MKNHVLWRLKKKEQKNLSTLSGGSLRANLNVHTCHIIERQMKFFEIAIEPLFVTAVKYRNKMIAFLSLSK